MRHKPIRIDWDELEVAFSNQSEELAYYLDLVTGHVMLEGEGEENDDESDEDLLRPGPANAPPPVEDETRAPVPVLTNDRKLVWMKQFIDEIRPGDPDGASKLGEALEADDSAAALKAVLREDAELRDPWYLYRSDRLHDEIEEWLTEQQVTAIDPAPWKS